MKVLLCAVVLVCLLQWANGYSTNRNSNSFSIGSILRNCPDFDSRVSVTIAADGNVVALPSRFKVPKQQLDVRTMSLLLSTLGRNFNRAVQSFSPPPTIEGPDMCPNGANSSTILDNEEGLTFRDYVGLFERRYREENITDQNLRIFAADVQRAMLRTFQTLDCRVDYNWVDAGPSYFPRYYSSGFCRGRRCSVPDRSNFLCRPDLSNPNQMGKLYAFRWDCCWSVVRRQRVFACGWRQVEIPVVCDCDCTCGAQENLDLVTAQAEEFLMG